MKNIFLLFVLIVLSISLKSQNYKDYIIKMSGDTIKCKINFVDDKYIFFKYIDVNKGKNATYIKLKDVNKYIFENEPEIIVQNDTIQTQHNNKEYNNSVVRLNKEIKLKYEHKVVKFTKMKNSGSTLMRIGGVGLTIGAFFTCIGVNEMLRNESSEMKGYFEYEGGIALMFIGGTMLTTGIVLNIIGKNNLKKYQNKLDLGIRYDNKLKGFSLVYKF